MGHVKTWTIQSMATLSIVNSMKPSQITAWTAEVNKPPATLFNFTLEALQQQLPTKFNLHRWEKTTTPTCPLCSKIQTNKHVLNNCLSTHALDRYKVRHDAVLRLICAWLQCVKLGGAVLHADLPAHTGVQLQASRCVIPEPPARHRNRLRQNNQLT